MGCYGTFRFPHTFPSNLIQMATPLRGFLVVVLTALRNIHHRTVNKRQKKMLSLLTLASQQLVSFFFSCVNGVNIKIATKINNTCILRTIAAV